MARAMKKIRSRQVIAALGSQRFFVFVVALLVVQAAWIALSGRYPMAFDEDFHFGIIKLYAHHPIPFWKVHPAGSDAFGAVDRDPSYLYHYVMSFPYRFITLFTHNQTAQVLTLRFINIGLFASGLILYRRLLQLTGASRALVHSCLLLFVLLPIVPLLAAQINYDNLFLSLVALSMLLAFRVSREARRYRRFNVYVFGWWLIVCLLTSLVKYAFLPIFFAEASLLLTVAITSFSSLGKFGQSFIFGLTLMGRLARVTLLLSLVLAGILFFERYGLNLVHYHTPVPDCDQVLTVKQCSAYAPWARDYTFEQIKTDDSGNQGPFVYTARWLDAMWVRTYFAVDGPATQFETRGPLTVPALSGVIFGLSGLVVVIAAGRRLWRHGNRLALSLFTAVSAAYVAVLWIDEYHAYVRTGQPVAINGRYLLPILPLVIVVVGLGLQRLMGRASGAARLTLVASATICLLWGGGALTYILRSRDAWYWQASPLKGANESLQRTLGPLTPGYNHPIQYLP
jgi:hypothetical protein